MAAVLITSDYRVPEGERVTYSQDAFVMNQQPPALSPNLWIDGSVTVEGTSQISNSGVQTVGGYFDSHIIVGSNGALIVNSVSDAYGVRDGGWTPEVTNNGRIEVTGKQNAYGVTTSDSSDGWTFENNGTFKVTSNDTALGVQERYGGTVRNSGLIEVRGGFFTAAVGVAGSKGSFFNTGTITAHNPQGTAIGVYWSAENTPDHSWVNRGTIEADVALRVTPLNGPNVFLRTFINEGRLIGAVDLGPGQGVLVNSNFIQGDVGLGDGQDVYDGRLGALNGQVSGGDGDDSLAGGAAIDSMSGGAGADTLNGGAGDDVLDPAGDSDLVDGGAGWDTLDYRSAASALSVDLASGVVTGSGADTVTAIERIVGGAYNDTLRGSGGADTISGGGGQDVIDGRDGTSYLRGDDGDDSIVGGSDFDDINGNVGNDTAAGGLGDDWVVGGKDNDSLQGNAGGDIVYGNIGSDTCDGGDGGDIVRGGQDNDLVLGRAGDDWLSGDRGSDTVTGGTGADVFHTFNEAGLDRVTDFNRAEGDRVMVDPGTTYTISQSGADVVIDMGGGNQMVLVGVQMSSLAGDWIFGA